jgi:hypothetical protein
MYLLAAMSRRYNIGIVAYAMMPNHIHIIVNPGLDPSRPFDLPEFKKQLLANFSKIVNKIWDRNGHVMCRDSTGDCIRIVDDPAELQQISYVECNGVAKGYGRRPEDLDGAVSMRRWLTNPIAVSRPQIYFQEQKWADQEVLRLCVPKLHAGRGHNAATFQKLSQERLLKDLRRVRRVVKKAGKPVLRLRDLESRIPVHKNESSAADHSCAHIVGQDKARKAAEYHNLRAFWAWHADALRRLKEGEEDVLFPPGTYKAVQKYGARVASHEYFRAKLRRRDRPRANNPFELGRAKKSRRSVTQLE